MHDACVFVMLQRWRSRRVLLMAFVKTARRREDATDDHGGVLLDRRCARRLVPQCIMSSYTMGMVTRFIEYEVPRKHKVMCMLGRCVNKQLRGGEWCSVCGCVVKAGDEAIYDD